MNWCIQVSKHKFIEIEANIWKENCKIFQFNIDWTQKCDHAGFRIDLEFLELTFNFNFYDHRHWNYEKKDWQDYEKQWPD